MFQVAYIGLGSNLGSPAGPPAEIVSAAVESLATLGVIVARSSLYMTEPVGYAGQPGFVNAVVALRTDMDPEKLLHCLLVIERSFGRDRATSVPKGPRTLDLDLLLMGDVILESPSLAVPHPELAAQALCVGSTGGDCSGCGASGFSADGARDADRIAGRRGKQPECRAGAAPGESSTVPGLKNQA